MSSSQGHGRSRVRGGTQRGDEERVRSQFSEMSFQHRGEGSRRSIDRRRERGGRGGERFESRDGRYRTDRGGQGGRLSGPSGDRGNFTVYPETQKCAIIRESEVPPGIQGTRIELLANYLPITLQPLVVYQYDLDFSFVNEEDKSRFDNEKLQKYFANAASILFEKFVYLNQKFFEDFRFVYDNGKNMYCTKILQTDEMIKSFMAEIGGRKRQFRLEAKRVQKLDLSLIHEYFKGTTSDVPEVVIHFLELLFQNIITSKYFLHNQKFLDSTSNLIRSPKEWIQFAQGFSSGVRLTEIGPSLNIHLKTSCLISTSVNTLLQLVTLISDGHNPSSFGEHDIPKVNKIINGLKIFTNHTGRKAQYTIKGLVNKTPKKCQFMMKKNGDEKESPISVHDYFEQKYNMKLEDYPVVQVMGKKDHLIPLELCVMIEKQFLNNSKIDSTIQNELLRVSTHKPLIYFNHLSRHANEILRLDSQLMSSFGIGFLPQPVRFFGRVIDPPQQICGNRNNRFFQVPSGIRWAFFSFDRSFNERDIATFVTELKNTSRKYGMDLSDCITQQLVQIDLRVKQSVPNFFLKTMHNYPGCKLFFVALPQMNVLYNMVKHFGDQKYGIVTQCVNVTKAKNRGRGYIDNILLKVNGKLGGKNSVISEGDLQRFPLDHTKTMVIGVDVNHPSPTEKVESSISCAVGSYDHQFTLYSASIFVQKRNREEMIDCLEMMIDELLNEYQKVNNYLPNNLIVFRDGVSEGQFKYAENEIKQIRTAFRRKVRNGKMIYIVTQKGHQTRFVLAQPQGTDRPVYNVPSGTVVDNTIIEPNQYMFYINSHSSPLGTSRPLKYVVLFNDFERRTLSNDDLQKLCFYLCFNCTRFRGGAIAMPIPVRYADLCAYRSKQHLEAQHDYINVPPEYQHEFEKFIIEKLNLLVKINDSTKKCLYYC